MFPAFDIRAICLLLTAVARWNAVLATDRVGHVDLMLIATEWSKDPNTYNHTFRLTQMGMVKFFMKYFDHGHEATNATRIGVFYSDETLTGGDRRHWDKVFSFTADYSEGCNMQKDGGLRGVGKLLKMAYDRFWLKRENATVVTIVMTDGYLSDSDTVFPDGYSNDLRTEPNKVLVLYSDNTLPDKSKLKRLAGDASHVIFYDEGDPERTFRRIFDVLCPDQVMQETSSCKVKDGQCQREVKTRDGVRPECMVRKVENCDPDDCPTTPKPASTLEVQETTSSSVSGKSSENATEPASTLYPRETALSAKTENNPRETAFSAKTENNGATSVPGNVVANKRASFSEIESPPDQGMHGDDGKSEATDDNTGMFVGVAVGAFVLLLLILLIVVILVVRRRRRSRKTKKIVVEKSERKERHAACETDRAEERSQEISTSIRARSTHSSDSTGTTQMSKSETSQARRHKMSEPSKVHATESGTRATRIANSKPI